MTFYVDILCINLMKNGGIALNISLCMIVKNEENNIINCLDRAIEYVDETIIVDTGSTDKTLKLLYEHYSNKSNVKIIEYKWENDFSKARNETLKYCTGDWILVLDADERIFMDRSKLEAVLEKGADKTFVIPIYNVLSQDDISVTSTMVRLYKNNNPSYFGTIHEQLKIDNKMLECEIIDSNVCKIIHYGYCDYVFKQKNKNKRNMDLIMDNIKKDPEDPFHWYNKGAMEMIQGNYDIAIDDFLKSYRLSNNIRRDFHSQLLIGILMSLINNNEFENAIEYANKISDDTVMKKLPDVYYYCGISYANIKKYDLAISKYKKAIEIGEFEKGTSKFGAGSFLPMVEWSKILYNQKKNDLAIQKLKEALLDKNNVNKVGLNALEQILMEENRLDELDKLLNNSEEINKNSNSNDLMMYSEEIKKNIVQLVEEGSITEAKQLIEEYENIMNNDLDLLSIKGVISMMEDDFSNAEIIMKKGLDIDNNNFDLLYNLAYLYHNKGDLEIAVNYYKRALMNASKPEEINNIQEMLNILEFNNEDTEKTGDIPDTSIIILTYNNLSYNKLCIDSIRKYTEKGTYEIIIVDNNSTDGTVEWLKEQDDLKIIFNDNNQGFPRGCNQGIEIANKENDIVLLNNDTVVTPNWLTNVKKCLYSDELIGVVGGVTNSCSNYQTIVTCYDNMDEMITFAEKNNLSNKCMWEERLRLVGYFMLIKNKVIKEVGVLDGDFTPGNFEDDDYSFRVRKAGYRLMLCKDSYIHHFGSVSFGKLSKQYEELLKTNRGKFEKKWGFDPCYIMNINFELTDLIKQSNLNEPKILHIGCEGGGTLLDIKNSIHSAELYGIEPIKNTVVKSNNYKRIEVGEMNKIECFEDDYFDFIIITNSEIVNDNTKYYHLIIDKLNSEGKVFLSSQNNANMWDEIISDLDKNTNINIKLLEVNENQIIQITKGQECKINVLYKEGLETKIINNNKILTFLRRLEFNIEFEKNYNSLKDLIENNSCDINKLKDLIINECIDKVECFNIMGVVYYELSKVEDALALLNEAYILDKENDDSIYNIIYILYQCNENRLALDFLNDMEYDTKNERILELKKYIEEIA